MERKAVILTTALLFLAAMVASPVMAITRQVYWEHVEGAVTGPPAKTWQANGIMHMLGLPFTGSYVGTLGTGTMEVCFKHITINTESGEGTCFGTWQITVGGNTLSGSANGRIIGGLSGTSEGFFRGTHGTGDFKGIEKMGTYFINLTSGELDAVGIIIYH